MTEPDAGYFAINYKVQIITTLLLLVCSITNNQLATKDPSHNLNIDYFYNFHILGHQNLDIYQEEDNVAENFEIYGLLTEIEDHFQNVFDIVSNYDQYVSYNYSSETSIHQMIVYQTDNSFYTINDTVSEIEQFIFTDIKHFLNTVSQFQILYDLGFNQKYSSIKLKTQYKVNKKFYVKVNIFPILNQTESKVSIHISRILTITFAIMLILMDASRLIKTNQTIQKQPRYWIYLRIAMNILILLSTDISAAMACLQIVPMLEKLGNKYLFSFGLRDSIVIILIIELSSCIFLMGVIMYSMLQFPGQFFQDVTYSFFSYFYVNFQCAIYEIFMQIEGKGFLPYAVYFVIYFYMALVAHSLIPSVFCSMVRKKLREQNIRFFINNIQTFCPQCNAISQDDDDGNINRSNVEITIHSSKIQTLVTDKIIVASNKENARKFQIEQERPIQRQSQLELLMKRISHCGEMYDEYMLEIEIYYAQNCKKELEFLLKNNLKTYEEISRKCS